MSAVLEATRAVSGAGRHICLVVDDDRGYDELAARFLMDGNARREKTLAFGPEGSALQERLRPLAAVTADPYVDFLGRDRLEPEKLFAQFREQAASAPRDGYRGLRVAADMDWLLPASTADEALRFEVMLDRVVSDLDATVLCAYRRASFDSDTILGMVCTHPAVAGQHEASPFRLVAGTGCWTLSGEIDLSTSMVLNTALRATASAPWVLDVSGLAFADVAGLRTIAVAAVQAGIPLEMCGAPPRLRRIWELAGFHEFAPHVRFVD